MKKKAVITFLGNAYFDSRVMNLYSSLKARGVDVEIVSFDFRNLSEDNNDENITIYKLKKSGSSLFFYLAFAVILMKRLAFGKYDLYFAEDIYTLPFVQFWAGLRGGKLIYDSRELYPFLTGLRNKSVLQRLIAALEKRYIYEADYVLVTGEMDGDFLRDFYGLNNLLLLRNLPFLRTGITPVDIRKRYDIPEDALLLIYQGVLLEGRGIKIVIDAVTRLQNVYFIVLGDGEFREEFERYAEEKRVSERVKFLGMIPQNQLLEFSAGADVAVAIIENLSKSYFLALPNKLFEYIMAGTPVITSPLPQMQNIVEHYGVGYVAKNWEPEDLAKLLASVILKKEELELKSKNAIKAAEELNWEVEFEKIEEELLS